MADISFLLLTFFLLTSSIDTDLGIARRLPPPLPPDRPKPPDIHRRNIFEVKVRRDDKLLFNSEYGNIENLKDRAKEFLGNPNDLPNLPEKEEKKIQGLGTYKVSKGVISLQNDRGTSYDMYIQVQNELTKAVNEMRSDLSKEKFGRIYEDLTPAQRKAIDEAIPVAISEAEPKNVGGN